MFCQSSQKIKAMLLLKRSWSRRATCDRDISRGTKAANNNNVLLSSQQGALIAIPTNIDILATAARLQALPKHISRPHGNIKGDHLDTTRGQIETTWRPLGNCSMDNTYASLGPAWYIMHCSRNGTIHFGNTWWLLCANLWRFWAGYIAIYSHF